MSESCSVYTADGIAQLHDFFSNGLALLILSAIGIGSVFACYRFGQPEGGLPRRSFLALAALAVLLAAGLTFIGMREVSTTARCASPGPGGWGDDLIPARVERFGFPAYAVVSSREGDASPQRRVHAAGVIADGLFWTGLACVFLTSRRRGGGRASAGP